MNSGIFMHKMNIACVCLCCSCCSKTLCTISFEVRTAIGSCFSSFSYSCSPHLFSADYSVLFYFYLRISSGRSSSPANGFRSLLGLMVSATSKGTSPVSDARSSSGSTIMYTIHTLPKYNKTANTATTAANFVARFAICRWGCKVCSESRGGASFYSYNFCGARPRTNQSAGTRPPPARTAVCLLSKETLNTVATRWFFRLHFFFSSRCRERHKPCFDATRGHFFRVNEGDRQGRSSSSSTSYPTHRYKT